MQSFIHVASNRPALGFQPLNPSSERNWFLTILLLSNRTKRVPLYAKGKLPPVLVLANEAAAPSHPVGHGRIVAAALGAELHVATTWDEAHTTWPGLVAEFVAKVAGKEGVALPAEEKSESHGKNVTSADKVPAPPAADVGGASPAAAGAGGVFSDVADGLTISREELLRSSEICLGDATLSLFPEIVEGCKSYQPGASAPYVNNRTKGWNQAWWGCVQVVKRS